MQAYGKEGYIIGVIKDFNFVSLYSNISPMVFLISDRFHAQISARVQTDQELPETISYIKSKWETLLPEKPFKYQFLDNQFAVLYESEQRARSLFFSFSLLAIIIAVLGLYSFTSYTVQQKMREIGIRKVLGASIFDILKLFYTGYVKLLTIAALIALPIAFVFYKYWLQKFTYRTNIGFEAFFIPLVLAFVILLISVSYQTIRSALKNPTNSIRA